MGIDIIYLRVVAVVPIRRVENSPAINQKVSLQGSAKVLEESVGVGGRWCDMLSIGSGLTLKSPPKIK